MLLISSPVFEQHVTPPGHPERMERAHVFDAIAARWLERGGHATTPRAAAREELERVHSPDYLDEIVSTAGRAVMLDPDTFTSPDSHAIALLAAGAAVQAAEHALAEHDSALALVRPPGHHAERNHAMGFCLYNNVAVAASAMLARGLNRIAIVDIDVHHGNGTQDIFYDDPRVLYVSTHQHPCYPGTGAAEEVGEGDGRGFTVNVPMEAGCGDADYELVGRETVVPVIDEFAPELTLVSAGYDAHERDPLASMRLSTSGYVSLIRQLKSVTGRHGPLALVTEGGYELTALAECLEGTISVLDAIESSSPPPTRSAGGGARGARAVARARSALSPFWRCL
jgi:acetoin utilization deacetylase AcuC-like enzyme